MDKMITIAIFASGSGTNASKIIDRFTNHNTIRICLIASNKHQSGVLNIAAQNGISSLLLEKEKFIQQDAYVAELRAANIDFIVLAGFLWKIPPVLINAFPGKIINIHPALLPKYGGKGMYGLHVHQSVIDNKEKVSGITIHYVDEQYDNGSIIFQATCPVLENDTAYSLAARVQGLEHEHYPSIIEGLISKNEGF